MSPAMLSFCAPFLLICVLAVYGQEPKRRFEYKLSFKGPHLVQRDNTVPFWEYFGDALAGDEGIRITPSLRSKKGSVWSKNKLEGKGWEVEVGLRINGRGRIGADGMAIWFTEEKGQRDNVMENTVFGSADRWRGLGVFLDSFDNDGKQNNPYIMAVVNDGSMSYDHQNLEKSASDGGTQTIGGCLRDFRNKPFPVRVKIEYFNQVLMVKVHTGSTNDPNQFEVCLTASNVVLPQSGYIGISAATGGLADDHDVVYTLTHSLHDATDQAVYVSDEERMKYEEEYKKLKDDLERAKEEYRKENPDKKETDFDDDDEQWQFQSQTEKELKQIFDGQNAIHFVMKELNRKLDQMIGRQELVLSRVNQIPVGQGVPQQVGQQQMGGQQVASSPLQRHEVERIMNNQNSVVQQLSEMRQIINDVQHKANLIQNSASKQGGGGGNMQDSLLLHELRDTLNAVNNGVHGIANKPLPSMSCPPPVSSGGCLSPMIFVVGLVVQCLVTIGYMVYRSNKEAQAKKFY